MFVALVDEMLLGQIMHDCQHSTHDYACQVRGGGFLFIALQCTVSNNNRLKYSPFYIL